MNNIYELEYLNLYYEISNFNICYIDDLQFTSSIKDVKKIFPKNNTIYDLSKIYKYNLDSLKAKIYQKDNLIIYLNENLDELYRIIKYFNGILITNIEIPKYIATFVEKIDKYNIYEIE